MTLITGFLYKNTAGLAADSAVTGIVSLPTPENLGQPQLASVLGDTPFYDGTNLVMESCQKIYTIDEKILITFSGAENEGKSIIIDLRMLLQFSNQTSEVLMKYFGQNNFQHTEYIAAYHEDGIGKLFFKHVNQEPMVITHSSAIVMAGTNAKNIYKSIERTINNSNSNKFTPQQNLQLILGSLQGTAHHLRTLEKGVGGLFNDGLVTNMGIEWAKDTCFMLYSAKAFEMGNKYYAFRYNRHNAIFASNEKKRVLFYPDIDNAPSNDQIQEWSKEINNLIETLSFDFFVLISYDQKNIVVVENDQCRKERIVVDNGQFKIDGKVKDYMFQYHSQDPCGEQEGFEIYSNFLS